MRQAAVVALALTGTAGAADLSGTVWKYIQGQAGKNGVLNVSLVTAGLFRGLLVMEGTSRPGTASATAP